jgi:tetratricopeptide (TPR) repeat protein
VVTFDLKEELKKGDTVLNIPELFPNNEVGKRYFTEYNRILKQIKQLGDSTMTDVDGSYKTLKNDIANSFIDSYPFYYKISKNAEYYLTDKINYPRAILFLKLKGEIYPYDWCEYNDLADVYFKNLQYQLALDNYMRSIELHPDNLSGKKQIEKLKKLTEK